MSTANIKSLLVRLKFDEPGATDSKISAKTQVDLADVIALQPSAFQTGDIAWVVDDAAFFLIDMTIPTAPVFTKYGGAGSGDVTIYYGEEDNIANFRAGDDNFKPSSVGYSDRDAIIAARDVAGAVPINRLDIFEVSIVGVTEGYNYVGSLLGTVGPQGAPGQDGQPGQNGDDGAPLTIDAQGLLINIDDYCGEAIGFSYLATDTGELYFKETAPTAAPCDLVVNWTDPVPFGKGEPGAVSYFVYQRNATAPVAPALGTLNVPAGWFDRAPSGTDPLYMSTAVYQVKNDLSINPANFLWGVPVKIDGDDGLDGVEGQAAGFWVIWNDSETPIDDINTVPLPTLSTPPDLSGVDWYDDLSGADNPIWMGQALYDSTTDSWRPWKQIRVGGEQVPYKLNLFTRSVGVPTAPSTTAPYKQGDGSYTTGADVAGAGWVDSPPTGVDALYMSELNVYVTGTNNSWSPPVQIDGDEGISSGVWVIWSNSASLPTSPPVVETIISADGSSLDLSGTGGVWYDDVSGAADPTWMATSFYKPISSVAYEWTTWSVVKVKGENGPTGDDGAAARAYFPITMFTRGENDLTTTDVTGFYVVGDDINGYNLAAAAPNTISPLKLEQDIDGTTYVFEDGVPIKSGSFPGDSDRVWMIQTVLNSVDNLGSANKANWGKPILLVDSQAIDFQYHDGDTLDTAGPKPNDPVGGGDPDAEGWYSQPQPSTFWIAQKNHSEGPSAQWAVYQSRGNTGTGIQGDKVYGLEAFNVVDTDFDIGWDAVTGLTGLTGYEIWVDGVLDHTVGPGTISANVPQTGVAFFANTQHEIKVRAVAGGVFGAFSAILLVTTTLRQGAPFGVSTQSRADGGTACADTITETLYNKTGSPYVGGALYSSPNISNDNIFDGWNGNPPQGWYKSATGSSFEVDSTGKVITLTVCP